MDRVPLFVQHEVERLFQIPHALLLHGQLAVGDGVELHPLHQLLGSRLVQHLEQPLVLGHAQPGLIELQRRIVPGLGVFQQLLGLGQQRVHHPVCFRTSSATWRLNWAYFSSVSLPTGPEMMSGVRASSMRIESTSSMMAYACSRCTR